MGNKMGTRSRLIIKRRTKPTIYLWSHWDGYLTGAGTRLCEQLKLLLEKYSVAELIAKIEALDLEESPYCQDFKPDDLMKFIEGECEYLIDKCDDIEYTYKIDLFREFIKVTGSCVITALSFDDIKAGRLLEDNEYYSSSDE